MEQKKIRLTHDELSFFPLRQPSGFFIINSQKSNIKNNCMTNILTTYLMSTSASVNTISGSTEGDGGLVVQKVAQVIPSSSPTTGQAANSASSGNRQKLSTRFHSAQKINYKLAALSNFACTATGKVDFIIAIFTSRKDGH